MRNQVVFKFINWETFRSKDILANHAQAAWLYLVDLVEKHWFFAKFQQNLFTDCIIIECIKQKLKLFYLFFLGLPPNPQIGLFPAHSHFSDYITADLYLVEQLFELIAIILAIIFRNLWQDAIYFLLEFPLLSESEEVLDLTWAIWKRKLVKEGHFVLFELNRI